MIWWCKFGDAGWWVVWGCWWCIWVVVGLGGVYGGIFIYIYIYGDGGVT